MRKKKLFNVLKNEEKNTSRMILMILKPRKLKVFLKNGVIFSEDSDNENIKGNRLLQKFYLILEKDHL